MTFSFNLLDKPWIPCLTNDGVYMEKSLSQLLKTSHQIRELAIENPLTTAALHRLLLSILHRLFGPKSSIEWIDLWSKKALPSTPIDSYFQEWHTSFDLFDTKKPFFQSSQLHLNSKKVSVRRLIPHLNAGNMHFEHYDEEKGGWFSPAQAALAVITSQYFGICGTSGAFFPKEKTGGKLVQGMFADALCTRNIYFMLVGKNLFETLLLNLVQYPNQIILHSHDDAPTWELPDANDPGRSPVRGYLDYLTWLNRRILLFPEQDQTGKVGVRWMRWEPAAPLDVDLLDPNKMYKQNKKEGYFAMEFSENRNLWRDSDALLSVHKQQNSQQYHSPAFFQWVHEILTEKEDGEHSGLDTLDVNQIYMCLALGMSTKRGQDKVFFYGRQTFPVPLAYLKNADLVNALTDALAFAEKVFSELGRASELLGVYLYQSINTQDSEVKKRAKSWVASSGTERHYWQNLELYFLDLLTDLPQDIQTAQETWNTKLKETAVQAFDQCALYAGDNAKALKAAVHGRRQLYAGLNKLFGG